MFQVRNDPETFTLARRTLDEAYALAMGLVLGEHLTVVVGEMRSEGFVRLAKLKYCEIHVHVTPGEPS